MVLMTAISFQTWRNTRNDQEASVVSAYPVDVCASLADVPLGVVVAGAAFDLQESGILVLVAESALEAGEHGLGVEASRLRCHRAENYEIKK